MIIRCPKNYQDAIPKTAFKPPHLNSKPKPDSRMLGG